LYPTESQLFCFFFIFYGVRDEEILASVRPARTGGKALRTKGFGDPWRRRSPPLGCGNGALGVVLGVLNHGPVVAERHEAGKKYMIFGAWLGS
jgi:hypothetical protein